MSFLMIPLTFLYDEYIDRSKLCEQKNPFEYIVPSLTSGVGIKIDATEPTPDTAALCEVKQKLSVMEWKYYGINYQDTR